MKMKVIFKKIIVISDISSNKSIFITYFYLEKLLLFKITESNPMMTHLNLLMRSKDLLVSPLIDMKAE